MKTLPTSDLLVKEEVFKKSRFITLIQKIESKEELDIFLKKNIDPKARHNCYAFKIGNQDITYGYDNDGEPQGTAGEPLFKMIDHFNLSNIIILVVRYFGGIKLGVGPLLRAYLSGAKELLNSLALDDIVKVWEITISHHISQMKKIDNLLHNYKVEFTNTNFEDEYRILTFTCAIDISSELPDDISIINKGEIFK